METKQAVKFEASQDGYEGIIASNELFDRASIEREAWNLVRTKESRSAAEVPRREYQDNARTALMEALTASGHLSRVEISGTLEDINHQVLSRLLNGWDDNLAFHEKQRRFAELCNELVIQKTHRLIAQGRASAGTAITEVSDYPVALSDQVATELGYRTSNRKGMVRSTHLRLNADGSYTRVIEQVSRAQATTASSFRFFKAAGVNLDRSKAADLAVLEAPFVYSTNQYLDGVIDIVRRLDGQSIAPVLYGDSIPEAQRHAPYEVLREESARREAEIMQFVDELADLEKQLAEKLSHGQINKEEQTKIYNEQVMRVLNVICTNRPQYATDTFGQKAGRIFEEAARLYAQGSIDSSQQLLESAEYLKETVTFCGQSITVQQAQENGLKVSSYLQLMEKTRESWKWKKGVCVVKECPTRPAKTEVGPCSVCRKCQKVFDKGDKPQNVYKTLGFLDWLFGLSG